MHTADMTIWTARFLGLDAANAVRAYHALIARAGLWRLRARTRRHLWTLDARLLADVGLSRAACRRETEKWFWQA